MSWSISTSGTREEVVKRIEEQGASFTGLSKREFDDAKPHLLALVGQNYPGKVSLQASGHAVMNERDEITESHCSVTLNGYIG